MKKLITLVIALIVLEIILVKHTTRDYSPETVKANIELSRAQLEESVRKYGASPWEYPHPEVARARKAYDYWKSQER